MTRTPFTCDSFAEHVGTYLEGDADSATRGAMDAHSADCAACGALLADLAILRDDAATLPELAPSRDLWLGISERIETPVVPLTASGAGRRESGANGNHRGTSATLHARRRWWAHPALAAAALVGITAGVTYYTTREAMQPVPTGAVAAGRTVAPNSEAGTLAKPVDVAVGTSSAVSGAEHIEPTSGSARAAVAPDSRRPTPVAVTASYRPGDLAALDSLYYREILRLRRVLDGQRGQLDSTTVQVLDRNMRVIDRAIQECRAALAADPASRFLNEQLNDALETKIELLRTAAVMSAGA